MITQQILFCRQCWGTLEKRQVSRQYFFWYKVSTFSCKLASSCRITYNLENLSCQKRALGYQVREGQGILFRSFKGWRLFFIVIMQSAIMYLITRLIDWVIVVFEIDPSSPAAAVELEIRKKLHISFDFARGYLYLRLYQDNFC